MRKVLGGLIAAIWLILSVVLWAGGLRLVPAPAASGAVGLSVSQAVLLAYHLSDVLGTLFGAYLSLQLGGLLAGLWLLVEGRIRRIPFGFAVGVGVVVAEAALGLFTWIRASFLLPAGASAQGLLNASSIAGQLAAEMIPAALLLAAALGAILVSTSQPGSRAGRATAEVAAPMETAPSEPASALQGTAVAAEPAPKAPQTDVDAGSRGH